MRQVWAAEWVYTPEAWLPNQEVHFDNTGLLLAIQCRQIETPLLPGCLIPGLINSHTHSELSHLAGLLPSGTGMVGFARSILSLRDCQPEALRNEAQQEALRIAWHTGTQLVGDICNNGVEQLKKNIDQPIRYLFHEYLGAAADSSKFDPTLYVQQTLISPCPHAPYSVSDSLCQAIGRYCATRRIPLSIHLAESIAELEFCQYRKGEFETLFHELNLTLDSVARSPFEFVINNLPPITPLIAVHLIESQQADLIRLMHQFRQLFVCICPRSSFFIHSKLPDVRLWRKLGLTICIGTDSLASCPDLNLWADLKLLSEWFPEIDNLELIRIATIHGARALGLENHFGQFVPGTRPGLLHAPCWHPVVQPIGNVELTRLV